MTLADAPAMRLNRTVSQPDVFLADPVFIPRPEAPAPASLTIPSGLRFFPRMSAILLLSNFSLHGTAGDRGWFVIAPR